MAQKLREKAKRAFDSAPAGGVLCSPVVGWKINRQFVGASQLVILAEGAEKGALKDPQALKTLEKFERFLGQQKRVGGGITITHLVRRLYQMFQEGIPKSPRRLCIG